MNFARLTITVCSAILFLFITLFTFVALFKADWYKIETSSALYSKIEVNPFKICFIHSASTVTSCDWRGYDKLAGVLELHTGDWYRNHLAGAGGAWLAGYGLALIALLVSPCTMIASASCAFFSCFLMLFGIGFFGHTFASGDATGSACPSLLECPKSFEPYFYVAATGACLSVLALLLYIIGAGIDCALCFRSSKH